MARTSAHAVVAQPVLELVVGPARLLAQDAARQRQLVAPLTALVGQLVAAANAQGDGKLDHSALFRQIAQLNGRD